MRIGISNIAWDVKEDTSVSKILTKYHIDAIDIAPSKYFPDFNNLKKSEIEKIKYWWQDQGIEITGMQSLLYGTTGLNLFGAVELQTSMLKHLEKVCYIAEILGSPKLVFGSPKNRNRLDLSDQDVLQISTAFFKKLGDIAQSHNVIICLEPNPVCYGANFMTTTDEAALIVRQVDHPAIKIQLDTGTIAINNEDILDILVKHKDIIGHIHLSEPQLIPLEGSSESHRHYSELIRHHLPDALCTIEMLVSSEAQRINIIEGVIKNIQSYRKP